MTQDYDEDLIITGITSEERGNDILEYLATAGYDEETLCLERDLRGNLIVYAHSLRDESIDEDENVLVGISNLYPEMLFKQLCSGKGFGNNWVNYTKAGYTYAANASVSVPEFRADLLGVDFAGELPTLLHLLEQRMIAEEGIARYRELIKASFPQDTSAKAEEIMANFNLGEYEDTKAALEALLGIARNAREEAGLSTHS